MPCGQLSFDGDRTICAMFMTPAGRADVTIGVAKPSDELLVFTVLAASGVAASVVRELTFVRIPTSFSRCGVLSRRS